MIDWAGLAFNGLWVLGAAVILAALSLDHNHINSTSLLRDLVFLGSSITRGRGRFTCEVIDLTAGTLAA